MNPPQALDKPTLRLTGRGLSPSRAAFKNFLRLDCFARPSCVGRTGEGKHGRHENVSSTWVVSRHRPPLSLNDCKYSARQSIAINTADYSRDGIIDRLSPGA